MTVNIILNESNFVLWLQKLYMLNVKHAENSERYKEEGKKSHFCSVVTHLLTRLLSHLRICVSVNAYMLTVALVYVLLLTHICALSPPPYKHKSYENWFVQFVFNFDNCTLDIFSL